MTVEMALGRENGGEGGLFWQLRKREVSDSDGERARGASPSVNCRGWSDGTVGVVPVPRLRRPSSVVRRPSVEMSKCR